MKKVLLWLSGIMVALVAVLVIHIYLATHTPPAPGQNRQLSRIDFDQPVDSAEAYRIASLVRRMDGVDATYFNVKDGILVYTYRVGSQTSAGVFDRVVAMGGYKAHRYLVSAEEATKGCPAFANDNSLRTRLVTFISKL